MDPDLQRTLETLRAGGLVAWPTDTTWGLLARADRPEALKRIYALKNRPEHKPLQLLVASAEAAADLVAPGPWRSGFERLAAAFWPGGLTLVVPAGPAAPPAVVHGGKVGLRVPADAELREVLAALGGWAAATSLNRSGEPPVASLAEAMRYADRVDRVHPGEAGGRLASTVFDLRARRVLRAGAVAEATLWEVLEAP